MKQDAFDTSNIVENDEYSLELLRRAIMQEDKEAWTGVQQCLSELVRWWLHQHPKRDVALRLESEENYVAQTFERFWQATTSNRHVECITFAAALQYLRASLNGVMLDTLRVYARPGEVMLPETRELQAQDAPATSEVWEALLMRLSDEREKRLTYLLFHCGLTPQEIIHCYPQEWSDVGEIYRLKRSIMERLLHDMHRLHRWLG